MSDTREMIRQQMDDTKSDLSDKLQLLKLQIAETAQSTGNRVNATVEAVKETVETVQSAAKAVSNTFNVRRRISMHPWLALGACAGLGYLAGRRKRSVLKPLAGAVPRIIANQQGAAAGTPSSDTSATLAAIAAAYERGLKSSSWDLLRGTAIAATIEIVQDIAFRVAPKLLDRLTNSPMETRPDVLDERRVVQASAGSPMSAETIRPTDIA